MSSPDLTTYHELTLYDRSPSELVDRALLDAGAKLPAWVPREGNTEVVLIESLALEVAELVFAVNRLPGAVTEVLLRLLGVTRSAGTAATTSLTFTVADTAGYTVPVGTAVRLELDDGTGAEFTTDADLVIPAGSRTGTAAATATTVGAAPNGYAAGTAVAILTSTTFLESAELATSPTAGADPENTGAWLNRGVERLARLTDALVLPAHFTSAALEDARVGRAATIDNLDPATGPPGSNLGHVSVVVADQAGGPLTAAIMAELETRLEGDALANLDVHVIAPTVTAVNVTATLVRRAGYSEADVRDAAVAALDAYLDPAAWEWGTTVRRNELIALLDTVDGVDYVASLDAPAADVTLAGFGPLADLGVATITVNAP